MEKQKFSEKVRGMKISEIIMAMVDGLRAGYYTVDMDTFGNTGETAYGTIVCYGCAATHALTKISGVVFDADSIAHYKTQKQLIGEEIADFESTIDDLRIGSFRNFLDGLKTMGVSVHDRAYGIMLKGTNPREYRDEYRMETCNWKTKIWKFESLAKELEAEGC